MCAQRGVDSEMENSEGEEQRERGRERGGGEKRDTENEARRWRVQKCTKRREG